MNDKHTLSQPTTARATYRTPKLVRYGNLASLVQGGSFPFPFEDTLYVFVSTLG